MLEIMAENNGRYMTLNEILDTAIGKKLISADQKRSILSEETGWLKTYDHVKDPDKHQTYNLFAQFFSETCLATSRISGSTTIPMRALKPSSFMIYLEYVELQEARSNAREARIISIGAVAISLLALGATLLPVDLSEETINQLRTPHEPTTVNQLREAPLPDEPAVVYERGFGELKNETRRSGDSAVALP